MINLKCKICGGSLELPDSQIAICQDCGSKMLLPAVDSDVRDDMFNRGNYYRMRYEFDRAASAFEQIVALDPQDAEARFCLALCRYGVEYVKDPRSGEYKATCHRGNSRSILEDVDYQAALKYAPSQAQDFYRKQAAEIHEIWQQIMEIVRYETPYDVFICYKESPGAGAEPESRRPSGERTKDSVLAQELYEELTGRGVRVFFARISLEKMLGSAYEPHIFAALQSAKVMLVVSTCREHLEAVWVRNEWQRYINLRRQDRSREIIPVLQGMDAYDLPDELAEFIPRMIDETGVRQDLLRGILKITGHTEGNISMIRNRELEQLGNQLLVQGNMEEARTVANQMLNLNPENGGAYRILFLAGENVASLEGCRELTDKFEESAVFKRLLKCAVGDLRRELDELLAYRKKRILYLQGRELLEAENFEEAYLAFREAGDYKDAQAQAADCREKAQKQKADRELAENIARYREQASQARADVEQEWATLYPEVEARGRRLNAMNIVPHRPRVAATISSVLLLGLALMLTMLHEEERFDLLAIPVFVMVLVYLALRFFGMIKLFPKMGLLAKIITGGGIIGLVPGLLLALCEVLGYSLFPGYDERLVALFVMTMMAAVNAIGSLLWFFFQAGRYLKKASMDNERRHFNETELPELKRQLLARKLEELRGRYEPLIGAENCRKYGG